MIDFLFNKRYNNNIIVKEYFFVKKFSAIICALLLLVMLFVIVGCNKITLVSDSEKEIVNVKANYRNNMGSNEKISKIELYPGLDLNYVSSYYTEFYILPASNVEVNSIEFKVTVEKGEASKLKSSIVKLLDKEASITYKVDGKNITVKANFSEPIKVEYQSKLTESEKEKYYIEIDVVPNQDESAVQLKIENISIN